MFFDTRVLRNITAREKAGGGKGRGRRWGGAEKVGGEQRAGVKAEEEMEEGGGFSLFCS